MQKNILYDFKKVKACTMEILPVNDSAETKNDHLISFQLNELRFYENQIFYLPQPFFINYYCAPCIRAMSVR